MSFTTINLDLLPAPKIIEQPEFEAILAEAKADLAQRAPQLADALELESEPLVAGMQAHAYRELIIRAAVQDAGEGMLLAKAKGPILDHIGSWFGVSRLVLQEADDTVTPPVPEILEDDARLRQRIQLAPEGFTTAGSVGSYTFWALSASPLVKDVAILPTDQPGEVRIVVLSGEGNGQASNDLLDLVRAAVDPRRPITDHLIIESATIIEYEIVAALTLYDGPDGEVVRQASEDNGRAFGVKRHRLGNDITTAGKFAALYLEGVQDVAITSPANPLAVGSDEAAYCTKVTVTVGGRDV